MERKPEVPASTRDAPVSPFGPVAPVSPVSPLGPVSPVAPVAPVSPLSSAFCSSNAFEPVLFYRLFESLDTLRNGTEIFRTACIEGITVNVEKCRNDVENSIGIVTALCPHIGYTQSAAIAKRALREGKSLRAVILEEQILPADKLDEILDPSKMIS